MGIFIASMKKILSDKRSSQATTKHRRCKFYFPHLQEVSCGDCTF